MENHHGGTVLVDGVVYGFTKANGGNWMAQDLKSGQTLWEHRVRPNKSGSICFADGRLYCYHDKDGTLLLVQPNRQEFINKGELAIPRQTQLPARQGSDLGASGDRQSNAVCPRPRSAVCLRYREVAACRRR